MINKIYDIKNFTVNESVISFELSGEKVVVPLTKCGSKILPKAKLKHLQVFELDNDGIGIHWPMLDEDLSIAGLLRSAGKEKLIAKKINSIYLDDPPKETFVEFSKQPVSQTLAH